MKKSVLLAAVGIIAAVSCASAANKEGQFSVSPMIGGYTYESNQHLDTSLVYGVRGGYNFTKNIGVEALFDYVNTEKGSHNVDMYRYGAEMLYHFMPDNKFVPYVAAGYAGLNFNSGRVRNSLDYGVGAKYFLNDSIALRGDVRHIMYQMNDQTKDNIEYTIGAYIPFGGVKPAVKPVEPPPAPAPVPPPAPKAVEPPPAPAAPTAALTVSPATVTKGQTAVLNWKSKNASDCDIQPAIGQVPPQGARVITPADSTSYTLACSGPGGTATSAARVAVVTPPAPVVEAPKPKVVVPAEKSCSKLSVINIQFDTDKSVVKPAYDAELKKVADFLKEFPKSKGEISGHTDNVGSKTYNDKLSQSRAESVKKYIVEKFGIAADRLTAKGYGFSKPVVSNATKEGKTKNRRIEADFTCE